MGKGIIPFLAERSHYTCTLGVGEGSPDHFISKPNPRAQRWGHFIWNPSPPSQMLIGLVQGVTKASGGSQARRNTATQNKMFSKWICFFTNSNDSPPGTCSSVWRLLKLQMAMSNDNVQATPYPTPPKKSSKELSLVKHPECKVIH